MSIISVLPVVLHAELVDDGRDGWEVADLYFLQHHELQGRHQRHHDNVENAEDAISDDEPVNECLSRLFQKDVDERAIGRRDEDGQGWEGGHVFWWGEANPVPIFITQPPLQCLNDQCSI